jgi:hypothetical protein
MKNLINWVVLETPKRGKKGSFIDDLEISVYQNRSEKTKQLSSSVTFSNFIYERYKDFTKLKIGKIGDKIVFQFNNSDGVNIHINKSGDGKCKRLKVSSRPFVDMILQHYGKSDFKITFLELTELGEDTFLISKRK